MQKDIRLPVFTLSETCEILGVSKTATDAEIKSAFRKLAKKYHPDVSKEKDAAEKFKEVQEAYSVLSDKEKWQRRFYRYERQRRKGRSHHEIRQRKEWCGWHGRT